MTIAFNIEIWLIEACRSLATTPNSSSFASILEKKISLNNFFFPISARLICHCSWWSVNTHLSCIQNGDDVGEIRLKEIRAMLGWAHVTAFTYAIPFVNKTREEKKQEKRVYSMTL